MWKRAYVTFIVCLFLCSIQLIDIGQKYFKYTTKTYVTIAIVSELKYPAISICWLLSETLHFDQLGPRYGLWRVNGSYPNKKIFDLIDRLTVAQILDITRSNESLLAEKEACAIKNPDDLSWKYPFYNKEECHQYVTITKYLHRYFVCYKIAHIDTEIKYNVGQISFTSNYPGLMAMYFLNDSFLRNHIYAIYVHSKESADLYDSIFSIENVINFRSTNAIQVIFTPTALHRLESPYDTRCRTIPGFKVYAGYLYKKINRLSMEKLNHVHTLEHVYERYPYPIITPNKLMNQTFNSMFMNIKRREIGSSKITTCDLVYNVPQTITQSRESLRVTINWPQNSGITVQSVANQDSIDLIIYAFSSIGVWLGLSILSIFSSIEKSIISKFNPPANGGQNSSEKTKSNCKSNSDINSQMKFIIMEKRIQFLERTISQYHGQVNIKP